MPIIINLTPISLFSDVLNEWKASFIILFFMLTFVIFGLMFLTLLLHLFKGDSNKTQEYSRYKSELLWSLVPFIILILLVYPAMRLILKINADENTVFKIKILMEPNYWQYQYINHNIRYETKLVSIKQSLIKKQTATTMKFLFHPDRLLVVPTNEYIRLLFISRFTIKNEIVESKYRMNLLIEKPGYYYASCATCDVNLQHILIPLLAKDQKQFSKWQSDKKLDSFNENSIDNMYDTNQQNF